MQPPPYGKQDGVGRVLLVEDAHHAEARGIVEDVVEAATEVQRPVCDGVALRRIRALQFEATHQE